MAKQKTSLRGMFVITLDAKADLEYAGEIIGRDRDFVLVNLVNWLGGNQRVQLVPYAQLLSPDRVRIYATEEDWDDALQEIFRSQEYRERFSSPSDTDASKGTAK